MEGSTREGVLLLLSDRLVSGRKCPIDCSG